MKYWYQKPHKLLQDHVRTVLILEGFSQPVQSKLPLVTTGMPVLICKTEKTPEEIEAISQLTLIGKSAPPECWRIDKNTTIVSYFFKPFAMATLFNIAAAKLAEAPIDLANWNAHKTNALKTQLIYAGSTEKKVDALDNLLIQQVQKHSKECEIIKRATDEMLFQTDTDILSDVMNKLDLNQRTFQRMFKKYVGVSPNQYRRICQFQLSFAQLRAKEFSKLTDVAYDNGFADQSHFIRSFKEFTQTTPYDYLKSGLKKDQ